MKTLLTAAVLAGMTTMTLADNVNPGVIFGSGNANGSFTTATDGSNIEIGLRGKLRYNAGGAPENTFNYDGVDTYTFDPRLSANPSNRSIWNFEWSINTDVNDPMSSGDNLADFVYALTVSKVAANGVDLIQLFTFDPINVAYADHSIGDNDTTFANDTVAASGDSAAYASLIAGNNVAQQSWNLGFFNGNPTASGTYVINLEVFGPGLTPADPLATTDIYINVVPLPTSAFAGMGLLGVLGGIRVLRRR